MVMLRKISSRRNLVDINIPWPILNQNRLNSCFFQSFPKGDPGYIGFAIRMTAGLQPSAKLAMMNQDYVSVCFVQYPGRAGNVTRKMIALKAIGLEE